MSKIPFKLCIAVAAVISFQTGLFAIARAQQKLHAHIPSVIARSALKPISHLDSAKRLQLDIALPLRNQARLTNLLQQIYDPASPNYRHYLTVEQFTDEFGPTNQDYQPVVDFAKAKGLAVTWTSPNRMFIGVEGRVTNIEKLSMSLCRFTNIPRSPGLFTRPVRSLQLT